MNVRELMSRPAITCHPDDNLETVVSLMKQRDCGAVPVVDNSARIIGIITDRDICIAAYDHHRMLADIRVSDVSQSEVYSVTARDTVQYAEELMREHRVRRLPVLDERDRVIGIVSLNDIAREGFRERSFYAREVDSDEVLQTLAAVGEPMDASSRSRV